MESILVLAVVHIWKWGAVRSVFILLLSLLFCLHGQDAHARDAGSATGGEATPLVLREASGRLSRFPDPVLVMGEWVPELLGTEIGSLRMFRVEGGAFRPIRFQVDERTDEGDWIFPHGKKNNRFRSNGRLDGGDVILFMAKDAGDRVSETTALPEAALSTVTIGLVDPLDGSEGWVCLASFGPRAPALCSLPDYVRYDPETESLSSLCVDEKFIISEDGLHTSFYERQATPVEAGGSGENYVDRLKFRGEVRFFFDLLPMRVTEEDLGSDIVAYIKGPVRVLRRQEQFVKLPLGFRGLGGYADIANYESVGIVPIEFRVPRGIHRLVSSAVLQVGTDFAPSAIGSFYRNSENPEPLVIDGKMSEAERRFNTKPDRWRVFYGPQGALITSHLFPPEVLEIVEVSQRYLDDLETALPPERYPGSIGFTWTEIRPTKIRSGVYRVLLDFYHPFFYKPGDEGLYTKMRTHPLRIRVGGKEYTNPLNLGATVGKDF